MYHHCGLLVWAAVATAPFFSNTLSVLVSIHFNTAVTEGYTFTKISSSSLHSEAEALVGHRNVNIESRWRRFDNRFGISYELEKPIRRLRKTKPLFEWRSLFALHATTVTNTDVQNALLESSPSSSVSPIEEANLDLSFSHVHLYADFIEKDISIYKDMEKNLNTFARLSANPPYSNNISGELDVNKCCDLWKSIVEGKSDQHGVECMEEISYKDSDEVEFLTQNRDVVKQLIHGLGFRVTGMRYPHNKSEDTRDGTKSLLLTTKDPSGVQVVVSSLANHDCEVENRDTEHLSSLNTNSDFHHFNPANIRQFYDQHSGRQGIAVLGFEISGGSATQIYNRYRSLHPHLIPEDFSNGPITYEDNEQIFEIFEVYAYYQGDSSGNDNIEPDFGTKLRFVERKSCSIDDATCLLPGLDQVPAVFEDTCMPAYCDHWVSNVFSRTGFMQTLKDTLGFSPKVDFNAGVVAAGEAQIESTVIGNDSSFITDDRQNALRDQSQVYLPINNALSEVGHVHGFLEEFGQGIQHIASRVDDLTSFVQRGNDYRKITGEGFTFLNIPRSYYGVLTLQLLMKRSNLESRSSTTLSSSCASAIYEACLKSKIMNDEGAVDLDLSRENIIANLDPLILNSSSLKSETKKEYLREKDWIVDVVSRSRYINLNALLGDHLTEESYLGIVRNKILLDVQGEDILFQIFSCQILQRNSGEEAPFFEFIQRVCTVCDDENGVPAKIKPGCGGFGIRNFLTLFLSIEVSKAMRQVILAREAHDIEGEALAQRVVDLLTDQLNESNPILNKISDAMTEEGRALDELRIAIAACDEVTIELCENRIKLANEAKLSGNDELMTCSTKYKDMMKSIRKGTTITA